MSTLTDTQIFETIFHLTIRKIFPLKTYKLNFYVSDTYIYSRAKEVLQFLKIDICDIGKFDLINTCFDFYKYPISYNFIHQFNKCIYSQERENFLISTMQKYDFLTIYKLQKYVIDFRRFQGFEYEKILTTFKYIVTQDVNNGMYQLYLAQFIARCTYGRTKEKYFLNLSENLLLRLLDKKHRGAVPLYIVLSWLGLLYAQRNDYNKALEYINLSFNHLEFVEDFKKILEWKCFILIRLGEFQQVYDLLKFSHYLSGKRLIYLAHASYKLKKYENLKFLIEEFFTQYFREDHPMHSFILITYSHFYLAISTGKIKMDRLQAKLTTIRLIRGGRVLENLPLDELIKIISSMYRRSIEQRDAKVYDLQGMEEVVSYYFTHIGAKKEQ